SGPWSWLKGLATKPYRRSAMTTAVDKWPAAARLVAVAAAGHLPTAPTPPSGTRPPEKRAGVAVASLDRAFPQRSPPRLLPAAACGGLRSALDHRTRRALLHLS